MWAEEASEGGEEMSVVVLSDTIPRFSSAVECPKCSGFAPEAEASCTRQEVKEHQHCGRSFPCCIQAYECKRCHTRIIAHLEAPEMD